MSKIRVGFGLCGSFCNFSQVIEQIILLVENKYEVLPIMSKNASSINTRFGKAKDIVQKIERITSKKILSRLTEVEPIGPKRMVDIMVIAPCTGNTLSKISNGISNTSVSLAAKSHLRVGRPVLIALATNDGLGASGQNIGKMLNTKNIYFVPMHQDDPTDKPNSLVARFGLLEASIKSAIRGKQIQPVFT
ncbi:MAG: dipicolinate synthase subunit B [Oscillospiraceae bacterium]|jgi:dipicolinate synthase subunit B|nr:dipicolinate synthase subunit B [Oscillospiraceae bacterium]